MKDGDGGVKEVSENRIRDAFGNNFPKIILNPVVFQQILVR
jgi:hypothetical protein